MNGIYFRKICYPTIEVAAFRPIHCSVHSFFWGKSFGFARLQNASPTRPRAIILIFLLFFIRNRSIPCGKQSTKMNSSHRLHLEWKTLRKLLILLKDIAVEKMVILTIDQKSCKRIFICGSACICSSVFVGTSRFGISWIAWTIATNNSRNWLKSASNNLLKNRIKNP